MALVPGQVVAVASPENVTALIAAAAIAMCAEVPILLPRTCIICMHLPAFAWNY